MADVAYNTGAVGLGIPTNNNFVSSFNAIKPDINNQLTQRYGNQLLTGLIDMVGFKKPTTNPAYSHFEERRYMPLIQATNAGAGAPNAAVTFTLTAAASPDFAQNFEPFPAASTVTRQGVPVIQGMVVLIKPASGAVDPTTYIQALVTSVDTAAGTFVAQPVVTGDSIPAVTVADEIIIISTAFGDGSTQPESMDTQVDEYKNNTQIFRWTWEITGTMRNTKLWFETTNPQTGQRGYYWTYKGERDALYRFLNYREMGLLLGEHLDNVTLYDTGASAGNPNKITEGLIPFILTQGNTQNYSSVSGLTYEDMEAIVTCLDKQKGSRDNLFMCGIELSLQIDREFQNQLNNGAITYGNYTFDNDLKVNFQFSDYKIGEYMFNKKTYDPFNDRNTLGADGFNFPFEGMIIPMDTQIDPKTGEAIPSLCLRYLTSDDEDRHMIINYYDGLRQGDDSPDIEQVRYLSECGFEGFGGNRYFYVKKAS